MLGRLDSAKAPKSPASGNSEGHASTASPLDFVRAGFPESDATHDSRCSLVRRHNWRPAGTTRDRVVTLKTPLTPRGRLGWNFSPRTATAAPQWRGGWGPCDAA
jgi:hypothetical protein